MASHASRDLVADYREFRLGRVGGVCFSRLAFTVMHGNGNVILVLDEGLSGLGAGQADGVLAREICRSIPSVRVDGVAFVRLAGGRVRMTYFERDGTRSAMCGNALRCVAHYGAGRGYLHAAADVVATDDGDKWVSSADGRVRAALGPDREFQQVGRGRYFVYTGLPHLVLLVADLAGADVVGEGRPLRHDAALCASLGHPEGLHVDFMQRVRGGIGVRTYEVGVEDETPACGTGVAGSAAVAHRVWGLPYPIPVRVPGGRMLVEHHGRELVISGEVGCLFTTPATTGSGRRRVRVRSSRGHADAAGPVIPRGAAPPA